MTKDTTVADRIRRRFTWARWIGAFAVAGCIVALDHSGLVVPAVEDKRGILVWVLPAMMIVGFGLEILRDSVLAVLKADSQ